MRSVKMRALCAFLLFASFLSLGCSWTLNSTHSNVIPEYTTNISLRCSYNGQIEDEEGFDQLLKIRLLKQVSSPNSSTWETFAEIVYPNQSQPVLASPNQPGVSVSGHLGQPRESYLSVTWSSASDDTVGNYKCETNGLTQFLQVNKLEYTEDVMITNHTTVNDLLDIFNQMRRESDETEKLQDDQIRMLEDTILTQNESAAEENYCRMHDWPGDYYSLISDGHGCPDTPFSKFSAGHINVWTKTRYRPQHVFPPLFADTQYRNSSGWNLLRFHFCEMDNGKKLDWTWPKGSYCIAHSAICRYPFEYGFINFFVESTAGISLKAENQRYTAVVTHESKAESIAVSFCCRDDGDVNIPILLPNKKPFYFYRYGGTCQAVYNMDVTNVKFQLETDTSGRNNFIYEHADGTINRGNASIELCYYTPKKAYA